MALFSDYSFDDLIGDLDFSYPVGTETSGDLTVDDSGPSFLDTIFNNDTVFDNYDEEPPWTEIFGPSDQFLDSAFDDYSWLDDILQGDEDYSADDIIGMTDEDLAAAIAGGGVSSAAPETGIFGGKWGPLLRNIFIGSGGGPLGGNVLGGGEGGTGILGALLGLGGAGGGLFGGGQGGEGGLGSFLSGANPLLQFLAMKSLMGDGKGSGAPIGQQAYGQAEPFNYQDYQVTNLQPALMPGVGYANVGAPPPDVGIPEVPGMMHGGDVRPGDVTFAKLEPGEFVIQKPAVDAVGIETLEQINNMGNGRPYYV